ncbi:MAG TPA: CinA family nicotinamide mononucleotide deamidase-related protein, partial [Chloroflexi bacterium]|nr:CinA family nicotinamide mononucleotide deamidase-related protein [Chloroflexota bacterium]
MQAEIVTIGTELLLGEIIDTNSAWIAQQLTTIGLNLYYTTTVGDNLGRVADVLRQALRRSDVVITTGGLGPTVDDVTREAVARATDRDLALDEDLLQEITAYFARRGYTMTDNNRKQATLPRGATVIHNPVGTAPSFCVEHEGHVLISLPGVPHEMRYLMEHEVLPFLRERFGLRGIIKSRILRTCGIGESAIDAEIGDLMQLTNPTVGTAAHPGQTDVRITVKADSLPEAEALIAPVEAAVRERIGEYIFGVDQDRMGDVLAALLAARGLRLAVAETVTAGEIAQWLSKAPQGAAAFAGGLVLPGPEALQASLDVPAALVAQYGYPGQEVAD